MQYTKLPILLVAFAVVAVPMSVGAVSSTSYQIFPEQGFQAPAADGYANSDDMLNSASYQLQGAIEPYSDNPTSTTYQSQIGGAFQYYCGDGFLDPGEVCDGASLDGATCASQGFDAGTISCSSACAYVTSSCTTSAGGGGGGGGGAPSVSITPDDPEVSDEIAGLEFTYASPFLLYGMMDTDTEELTVNDESDDVEFTDDDAWKVSVSLSYGLNNFSLVAIDGSKSSTETLYEIYRRLIGDVNQDDTVNDYDLSKFVGLWGGSDRAGDFNEDETVDDYDFSMLVARWGTSV
ncbi:MAG: hypothetical protein NUV84_01630 [Candidatus Uhrbacteria bacterium]|nr:hypothetical protein [Candidatus Uhrbacteria bacterium]